MTYRGDNMTKDVDGFRKVLQSYVYLKECAAVFNERAELDLDMDIYDLQDYCDDLLKIATKYNIKHFILADNPDYDDVMEYVLYLENKVIQQLEDQLIFMYIISAE